MKKWNVNDDHHTTDMETLIDKIRVGKDKVRLVKELGTVFILLLGFGLGLAALGGLQYWTCTLKDPDMTFLQCVRGEGIKPVVKRAK